MADMTVTYKGAVPFGSHYGTAVGSGDGVLVQHDASYHGEAVLLSADGESVYAHARPYAGTDGDDFSWADEYAEAKVSVETSAPKRGKRK